MNIFHLSDSPVSSAVWQHDKHVVKMTLETAQLISQAIRLVPEWRDEFGDTTGLYGVTHQHHPSSKWARQSFANLRWLCLHGIALSDEYSHRFWRTHKSRKVIKSVLDFCEKPLFEGDLTPFAIAMPPKYKTSDPVLSYRLYYLAEKVQPDSKWTDRRSDLPDWLFRAALDV